MTSVFISYKRENLGAVQRVVASLRGAGLAVWWDQDIAPEAQWEATIERELNAAKVVIVVWSQASVASENVKAEARRARGRGKLIQVFVEPCEPPLFFGERQGIDLSTWNGEVNDSRFRAVLAAARAIIAGKRPPEGVGYAPRQRQPWAAVLATLAAASVVLSLLANLGGARDAICGLDGLRQTCRDWGIIGAQAPDPAVLAAEARQRLLAGVAGAWGRQDRDCAATVNYSVAHGADGFDRITATAPGFESVSQVIAAENGVIVAPPRHRTPAHANNGSSAPTATGSRSTTRTGWRRRWCGAQPTIDSGHNQPRRREGRKMAVDHPTLARDGRTGAALRLGRHCADVGLVPHS